MESHWLNALREIRDTVQEIVDDLKSEFELTAQQNEDINKKVAEGFNRIANSD